jgi:hypothetical protein
MSKKKIRSYSRNGIEDDKEESNEGHYNEDKDRLEEEQEERTGETTRNKVK